MIRIARELGQPIHHSLHGVVDYPYTISFAVRKRLLYDSFLELPKEKQPPYDIWDDPDEIDKWFDKVFEKPISNTITIDIEDVEG